jgi:hypothetical protein
MKRPPTIWITQSLLILFALLPLSAFVLNVVTLVTHLGKYALISPHANCLFNMDQHSAALRGFVPGVG